MANYRTHVSVGACAGLLTIGVSSLWLHTLGWDVLLLGVFFGFLGGMIPDIDHDRGHAVTEIGRLLSTMLPVVALAVWAHGRGNWVFWSLTVVIPNHYLLHWALPQMSWWGKVRGHTFKNAVQSIVVSGICAAPTLFLFPRLPYGYQKTWLVMLGVAAGVQLAIPIFKVFTVHRGMLHSVPFAVIFAEVVFLFLQPFPFKVRGLLSLAAFTGAISHLLLDEIYSVDFDNRKIVRIKRSFGTAFKFWTSRYPAASAMAYAFAIGLGVLSWMLA